MISNILKMISLFSLALALAACKTERKSIITLGTNLWPGFQTLYLARSIGAFDQQQVKLIEMPSGTETAVAFRNGSLDIAGLTLDEALTVFQYVPTLKLILLIDLSMGADVLLAQPEINSLEKLKGKRIGVEETAMGAIILHNALQKAALKTTDIEIKSITLDRHATSFVDRDVDAIVTFEPVKSKLMALGAKKLFGSEEIPGLIIDVLVTRQEMIDRYPEIIKTVVAGHFLALNYLHEHPEEAAALIAPNLGVEPDRVHDQFKHLEIPGLEATRSWLSGQDPVLNTSIATLKTMMLEQGLLFKPMDTGLLIDDSLLPSSEKSELKRHE